MFTRRTMLRALGLGAPAAAVAACLPAAIAPKPAIASAPIPAVPVDVSRLSALHGNMGQITAGRIISKDKRIAFDPVSGFDFSADIFMQRR